MFEIGHTVQNNIFNNQILLFNILYLILDSLASEKKITKGEHTSWLLQLLYIELTISFLIGRKRTVNFRNPRLWRHNCRLSNNHVKVTGYHVVYDRGAWFLRVLMSSSLALFFLPSVKKHKQVFFCFVQCIIKQLLDSVFVISRIIKVSVRVISRSLPYLDLDYSGYHKNLIQ